jgi:hypothetical protein
VAHCDVLLYDDHELVDRCELAYQMNELAYLYELDGHCEQDDLNALCELAYQMSELACLCELDGHCEQDDLNALCELAYQMSELACLCELDEQGDLKILCGADDLCAPCGR